VYVRQSSSLASFKRQINLIDLRKYLNGSAIDINYLCVICQYCCLGATSVSCLYDDLWHPVFQLKVLSSSSVYEVCYVENEYIK